MGDSRTHTHCDACAGTGRSKRMLNKPCGACGGSGQRTSEADRIATLRASHDGLVEALRAITEAAGNYCQAIDDIGTSGEPPEEHVDRLDALEECIRDALVVSRRALEAAGITEAGK